MDRKTAVGDYRKFSGGPVGLDNVVAAIGESADTIEDVGAVFDSARLAATHPARAMATVLAYQHFGLSAPGALAGIIRRLIYLRGKLASAGAAGV